MTLSDLLEELARHRIELHLDGDILHYRAPANAMSPEMRTAIARHRPAIIARLRGANLVVPDRCCKRHGVRDFGAWVDDPPVYGRIRTTCRFCGSFIGYRPHQN